MNKNSLVMFRGKRNPQHPMRIDDVREDFYGEGYGTEFKIDGKWWREGNIIPYKEWVRENECVKIEQLLQEVREV